MRVRGGAHARLIGKQPSCNAETHRLPDRKARYRTADSPGRKSADEDGSQSSRNSAEIQNQENHAADKVERRHNRNHLLREGGDSPDAADENKGRNHRHKNTDHHLVDAERGVKRIADGIGLHHVAHDAECENDGNRKKAGKKLPEAALERLRDVIDRAADHMSLVVSCLRHLCKRRLAVNGRHAEEGRQPHPEDRTGAAADKRRRAACNIAGSDLCRNGRCQCLEGRHAFLSCLIALQGKSAEHPFPGLREMPHLHESRADAEIDAGADQQEHQNEPYLVVQQCDDAV